MTLQAATDRADVPAARATAMPLQTKRVHGHDRAFTITGEGPPLLLLHGVGSNRHTWDRVIAGFAARHTVIAPDLLGHGDSAKPRADYSIGGYANGVRDLLSILDVERVSVVGHSFGGGVAMQFAYQYPERCDRVVLVAPGGLGPEVTPLLRMMTVPAAGPMLTAVELTRARRLATGVARLAARVPGIAGHGLDLLDLADVWDDLAAPGARWAFLHVLRAACDPRGQVVTMLDRSYLAAAMPMLLVWGDHDRVIPVRHAYAGHESLPGSQLEIFQRAGHFPHRDDPARFVAVVERFLRSARSAPYDPDSWRALLRGGRGQVDPENTVGVVHGGG